MSKCKIGRYLIDEIENLVLGHHKMLFLSGPRQCGKTTLAKLLLKDEMSYFSWDDLKFKNLWIKQIDVLAERTLSKVEPRVVLDEIHKNAKWKNQVKAFYDKYGDKIQIILTGSAHLNVFRKGADSLLGRFIHFHLHPLSYGELSSSKPFRFKEFVYAIGHLYEFQNYRQNSNLLNNLLKFGGFPEPFLLQDENFHQIWIKNRFELLIRQDVAELSNFLQSNQVAILAALLPDRVGSVLSTQSLKEDLDVAHTTVSRWLEALKSVYFHFDVSPYSKNIVRSLKKDKKIFLYDWSPIESEGPRFENMVACHLKKMVDFYNDTGQSNLNLNYLRNKDKNEVDFVILEKGKPLVSIEVKINDLNLDLTFLKFRKKQSFPHIQIVRVPKVFRVYKEYDAAVISFENFFARLP